MPKAPVLTEAKLWPRQPTPAQAKVQKLATGLSLDAIELGTLAGKAEAEAVVSARAIRSTSATPTSGRGFILVGHAE